MHIVEPGSIIYIIVPIGVPLFIGHSGMLADLGILLFTLLRRNSVASRRSGAPCSILLRGRMWNSIATACIF